VRTRVGSLVLAAACIALGARPGAIRAQEASPADSSLQRFLGGLADSTDRYFGSVTAAPLDTTGLDSALAARLERPWRGPRTRSRFSYGPVYAFNRVDGTLWGASLALSNRGARWRVAGDLGRAFGSDRWLGGGQLSLGARRGDTFWRLGVAAGRRTVDMDRDGGETQLATLRALVSGSDRKNYLRRDGVTVGITGDGRDWHAGLEFRDRLESPLAVTTLWNLAKKSAATRDNLAATFGRARELSVDAQTRLPWLPLTGRVTHQTADRAMGSDFDYRRTRLALGGEITVARRLSLVPQLAYGRLGGDPLPQAAFYLGGAQTLRSLPVESWGGTGLAIARLDVIGADDLLALIHIPHPAMFPIQGGLFVGAGAVWGADPLGGPGSPDGGWPERNAWISEAGASLLYRPGIPDDEGYLRVNVAWPLGPKGHEPRWTFSYSRALDLLRPF